MGLTFFKNNKPDTRMIEYDQAIIRLGLEKVEIEKEVEWARNDLRQLNISLELIREVFRRNWEKLNENEKKEVGERTKTLDNYKKLVYDSLQGIIFEDDKQIILAETVKLIDEKKPRVEIDFYKFA